MALAGAQGARHGHGGGVTDDTFLFRQVHPSWLKEGRATSQAFTPTPKDNRKLSVYDGDRIGAAESWNHYTGELGFRSVGVLAVTARECQAENTSARPDPRPFPQHAVIDFSDVPSQSRVRATGKRLTRYANDRGWQHGPID